jgi:hypothetical protein
MDVLNQKQWLEKYKLWSNFFFRFFFEILRNFSKNWISFFEFFEKLFFEKWTTSRCMWHARLGTGYSSHSSQVTILLSSYIGLADNYKVDHSGKRLMRMVCWKILGFWNSFSYKIVLKTPKIPRGNPYSVPHGIIRASL